MVQHVRDITRVGRKKDDKQITRDNILDLVITSHTSTMLSSNRVIDSHYLFNHRIVICGMNISTIKAPAPMRMTRNIKSIDRLDLENRIRSSPLFTNPAATADEYLAQIDTVATDILNEIIPLRSIRCRGLSPNRQLSLKRWQRSVSGDGSNGMENERWR